MSQLLYVERQRWNIYWTWLPYNNMRQDVYITDNVHGFEDISSGVMSQPLKVPSCVIIEDEAWIGEHACIMLGVTIGKHSVIGANSVVTIVCP